MIEDLLRLLSDSSLTAIATVLIGLFVLRDTMRVCVYIFDAATRRDETTRLNSFSRAVKADRLGAALASPDRKSVR